MKRTVLGSLILFLVGATLIAWQWPVSEGVLVSTFGQLRRGGFSRGVELAGGDQAVYPARDGELVFWATDDRFVHPLGHYVVLNHDGGFRTVYGHLEGVPLQDDDVHLREGDTIGLLGSSGFVRNRQVGFQIIDEELDAFVNPFLILPHRVDRRPPVIGTIAVERDGLSIEVSAQTAFGRPGIAELLVDVYDPGSETVTLGVLAPYEIVVEQDGAEIRRITFETLQKRDGKVLLAGRYAVADLYESERLLRLGSIAVSDAPSSVTISVRDFAGNTTQRTFILNPETLP